MDWKSLNEPAGYMKLLEIAATTLNVCLTLHLDDDLVMTQPFTIFYGGVIVMALVVTPLLLLTYLCGKAKDLQRTPFELMFNGLTVAFLGAASGVLILPSTGPKSPTTEKIRLLFFVNLFNAVIYLAEVFFNGRNMERSAASEER